MAKWKIYHQLKVRGQTSTESVRKIFYNVKLNYSTESLTYDGFHNWIENIAEVNLT